MDNLALAINPLLDVKERIVTAGVIQRRLKSFDLSHFQGWPECSGTVAG
jgi:hypothetical protein